MYFKYTSCVFLRLKTWSLEGCSKGLTLRTQNKILVQISISNLLSQVIIKLLKNNKLM